jgi:XTP/dITP diphosphohydrolase
MKKIVFATNNKHKLDEIRKIATGKIEILSLNDINCHDDIPETGTTLEENALIKARFVKDNFGYDCFADDTGLEVKALGGAPGIYSARYAGKDCKAEDNISKLLSKLTGVNDRSAAFRTVIALLMGDDKYFFEGAVLGKIIDQKRGKSGFGYDPIFVPDGYEQTFAELGEEIKNTISHRAIATNKLIRFLLEMQ